jgi:lipopolysaccharide export system permease protein
MAKSGTVEPWFGMWMSTFIIIPIAMFLTYKITTDSPLVSQEGWKQSLGKIKIFKKSKKQPQSDESC